MEAISLNAEVMMKKLTYVTMVVVVICSLAAVPLAEAIPCKPSVLEMCYSKCREQFSLDALRAACYGGCLVGCVTSGQS